MIKKASNLSISFLFLIDFSAPPTASVEMTVTEALLMKYRLLESAADRLDPSATVGMT